MFAFLPYLFAFKAFSYTILLPYKTILYSLKQF
nr:MAG TPA: hypothetical protein [Caudoviricetes sp.]